LALWAAFSHVRATCELNPELASPFAPLSARADETVNEFPPLLLHCDQPDGIDPTALPSNDSLADLDELLVVDEVVLAVMLKSSI
jgi:hypothetical protein